MRVVGTAPRAERDLHHPAQIHHRDPVADVLHHRQVVGDEQVGQPQPLLQVLQQVDHLRLHRHVERGDRLVADDQLRLAPPAPGRCRSAAAARRRTRAESAACGPAAAPPVSSSATTWSLELAPVARQAVDHQRLADDAAHGVARVERGERVLEDDLHLPPQPPAASSPCSARDVRGRAKRISPAVGSISRMMQRPVVDLPQPHSPTRPSVSPGRDVEADAVHRMHPVHLARRTSRRGSGSAS